MKTFLIIFWIHQAIFGLSSLGSALNLLLEGGTTNQSNLVPLLLAMIAGSLMLQWAERRKITNILRGHSRIRPSSGFWAHPR